MHYDDGCTGFSSSFRDLLSFVSAVSALSPEPINHSSKSLHLPIPSKCYWRVKSVFAIIGYILPLLAAFCSPSSGGGDGDFFLALF